MAEFWPNIDSVVLYPDLSCVGCCLCGEIPPEFLELI